MRRQPPARTPAHVYSNSERIRSCHRKVDRQKARRLIAALAQASSRAQASPPPRPWTQPNTQVQTRSPQNGASFSALAGGSLLVQLGCWLQLLPQFDRFNPFVCSVSPPVPRRSDFNSTSKGLLDYSMSTCAHEKGPRESKLRGRRERKEGRTVGYSP